MSDPHRPDDPSRSAPPPPPPPPPGGRAPGAEGVAGPQPTSRVVVDEPARPDRGGPPSWVLYAVIAALVILLGVVVLATTGDDEDVALAPTATPVATPTIPTPSAAPTPTPVVTAAPPTPVPTTAVTTPPPEVPTATTPPVATAPPPGEPSAQPTATQPAVDDPGSLATADGQQLFPVDVAQLRAAAGQQVTGDDLLIHEVVDGEGFWVGNSDDNRVFVAVDPAVFDLGATPQAGNRVDLIGMLVEGTAGREVPDQQGGQQLRDQGVHVRADQVAPAA